MSQSSKLTIFGTSSQPTLLRLPSEVLRTICNLFVVTSRSQSIDFICYHPNNPLEPSGAALHRSTRTLGALSLSCKSLYPFAIEALWSWVFLTSHQDIHRVFHQLKRRPTLGSHTREFDLRLSIVTERQEEHLAYILTCMPNLQRFKNANLRASRFPLPIQLRASLASPCCSITSISFGSGSDVPTISDILILLKAPTLKHLQLNNVELREEDSQPGNERAASSLTTLCLSTDSRQWRYDDTKPPPQPLLLSLTRSHSWPQLTALHVHDNLRGLKAFLRLHGRPLRTLVYDIPSQWRSLDEDAADLPLGDDLRHLCPILQDLQLGIVDTDVARPPIYGLLRSHPTLRNLHLKYPRVGASWICGVARHVRIIVVGLQGGAFPQLRQVHVLLVGHIHCDAMEVEQVSQLNEKYGPLKVTVVERNEE